MKKIYFSLLLMGIGSLAAMAQSGTNSPYSQYGLGVISDQSQGFNRGMNGLALGLRNGSQVNMQNPASYSSVDSLTMIFDLGVSGQITNFNDGTAKVNAKNAVFEYAVAAFRVLPKMGVSIGLVPFTNIGYNYSSTTKVGSSTTTNVETHSGSGGLHQAYIGVGYEVLKGLSVGANFSYLWGSYEKTISETSSDSYVNQLTKSYGVSVNSYKLDFGAQYQQTLSKKDVLTIGATLGLGHKLGADPYMVTSNINTQTGITTSTTDSISNGLSIPLTLGVGAAICHNQSLTVGLDYTLQRWGSLDYPHANSTGQRYTLHSGLLMDRSKFTIGADWIPAATSRNFLRRVHYKIGASYATPYYKINGQDGLKEVSISAGFGIPLINNWNNRSVLNVSAQWVHQSAKDLITENCFRINIGLTFNERWFAKWKVD